MATIVALLILYFVDEQFYDARYTQATLGLVSHVMRSWG
jgi:hypothetical protein